MKFKLSNPTIAKYNEDDGTYTGERAFSRSDIEVGCEIDEDAKRALFGRQTKFYDGIDEETFQDIMNRHGIPSHAFAAVFSRVAFTSESLKEMKPEDVTVVPVTGTLMADNEEMSVTQNRFAVRVKNMTNHMKNSAHGFTCEVYDTEEQANRVAEEFRQQIREYKER